MTEPSEACRFELVLEPGADPIEGALLADGVRRPFTGWTGLASVLEQALGNRDRSPPDERA